MKANNITVIVSGRSGVGKSTIATLIQRYLKSLGFSCTITLTDNEMPRCPTELRMSTRSILERGVCINVNEQQTTRKGIKK